MAETPNLGLVLMEVGQSNKETTFNDDMEILDLAIPATLPVPVNQGGTGRATLTIHSILIGNTTSPITMLAVGGSGTLLQGVAASDPTFTATPTLGVAGATLGTLTLAGNTSGVVTIKPQAAAGTFNFNLPTDAGSSGQPLLSGGGAAAAQTYGTLSVGAGGTGLTSYTVGDIVYASGASTLAGLADVSLGSYLRSGGIGIAPLWSTTTLPNSATAGDILHATGANVYGNLADVAVGRVLTSGGVGVVPVYSATPTLGVAGTTLGTLSVSGNTSGVVTIQPQAVAGTYNFNLPTSAGTSGQPLLSGGGATTAQTYGTLSVGAGGTGQITLAVHGVLVGNDASGITTLAAAAAGTLLTGQGASADPSFSATPTLGIATSVLGTISLSGNTSGVVTIRPAAAAGTWTFQLPTTGGTAGYLLQTNGSGVGTWAAPRTIEVLADAASITPAPNTDGLPYLGTIAALSQTSQIENPSTTPQNGQMITFRIISTTARTLTWGTSYKGSTALPLPTTTTGSSLRDYFAFAYNSGGTLDLVANTSGVG